MDKVLRGLLVGVSLCAFSSVASAQVDMAARDKAIATCVSQAQTQQPSGNTDTGAQSQRFSIYVDCMKKAGFAP